MRRAPIVIVATAAGLAAVLSFHTKSAPLSFGVSPVPTTTRGSANMSLAAGSTPGNDSSGTSSSANAETTPATTTTTPPSSATSTASSTIPSTSPSTSTSSSNLSATKSATGDVVNYNYGTLSVSVSVAGTKITDVQIAALNDGGNFRSESIDQQAVPILEQKVLRAQSANIQSVSGASYTSAGFEQSLQSALTKLGFK